MADMMVRPGRVCSACRFDIVIYGCVAKSGILFCQPRQKGVLQDGSFPLKTLWFLAVLLIVTVTVTVAAITGFFIFWSLVSDQPGTVAALAMLFLVAPGLGIASGIMVAIRVVRKPQDNGNLGLPGSAAASRWLLAGLAALVGGLAGYGACMATIDLTYTERWSDPGSAPFWLPMAPPLTGLSMAVLLALLVLLSGRRPGAARIPN